MLLVLLVIVGVSFGVMAYMLTNLVSSDLYSQRIRQDSVSVEKLASTLAPFLRDASASQLEDSAASAAAEMGGRVLVLDADGKVQCDSFGLLNGTRLQLPEALSVLTGNQATAYGIHQYDADEGLLSSGAYAACCAARMNCDGSMLGVLLYISPVDEMMDSLNSVVRQMLTVFVAVAALAVLASLLLSSLLTRPVTDLTGVIQRMGKGDLSVRAPVRGSGEMRELANSYNHMAEQLESLDKSRNQFVSNASHELKTPLTTMKICLESLIYQPDMPEELRTEFMQDINHEIDRLTGIVTDLLTLTRMDNKADKLTLASCDLGVLTKETVRALLPIAQKRGQTLTCECDSAVIGIVDRAKLNQVIYNLTENALKYTPDGGRIAVVLRRRGGNAVWQVTDNGVGIPQEDIAHIFDRFYRVDKARSRETGGTGLGLSIVHQLVLMHGGEISVESVHGSGSTFTVTIPLEREVDK